jgi:hypothetical protein
MNRKRTIPPFEATKTDPSYQRRRRGPKLAARLRANPASQETFDFQTAFLPTDMGCQPSPAHSIDRIDNNCAPRPLEGAEGDLFR